MRYLKALLAGMGLIGFVGGVPIGLIAGYGDPVRGITQGLVTDLTVLDLIVCLTWLVWLQMTICFFLEALNQTRAHRGRTATIPLPAADFQADLVRFIIGAILAVGVVSAPLTVTGKADAATPTAAPAATAPASTKTATRPASTTLELIVKPGDSLWELAERHLGDGAQWRKIADLNRGRDVGGGVIATTANLQSGLQPGWHLLIPMRTHVEHHIVEPGEDLSEIALETTGSARNWPSIYHDNQAVIGANPNVIYPGQDLNIPNPMEHARPTASNRSHLQGDPATQPARQHTAIDSSMSGEPASRPSASTEGEHTSAPSSDGGRAYAPSAGDMQAAAPWLIASLLTSGGVLSAFLYLRLRERRRDRFRARRPGHTIAVPDLELAPLEKTITLIGAPNAAAVAALDLALRRLGQHKPQTSEHMPALAAVELSATSAVLHLVEPTTLPAPWEPCDPDHLRWHTAIDLAGHDNVGGAEEEAQSMPAPYPLLATVGSDDVGHWWILNLEHMGVVTVEGDRAVSENLVRYLAAELAVANWAGDARIDLIGIASELEGIAPRLHTYSAAETSRPATAAVRRAEEMTQRCATAALDATTARTQIPDDEIWPAHLLIVNTTDDATTELIDLIQANPVRTATAVLTTTSQSGDSAAQAGLRLLVSSTGSLHIEGVGLTLKATQLPTSDAAGITRLYQQATDLISTSLPPHNGTGAESTDYADASGNLRREHTIPRGTPTIAVETTTLLEASDDAYTEAAACVEADLEVLAPHVPASTSTAITQSDPSLDEDLAEWINHTDRRPRLRLLGEVKAFAYGEHATTVGERISFYTELLAFLWTHAKQGATMEEILSAFPTQSAARVRIDIKRLREWLGTNPQTGQPILPAATEAPARAYRGRNVYQVDCGLGGLLVDVDLLRRLRLAGQAAGGASGVSRIATALVELVDGQPFSRLRDGGWSWLLDGDRIDEHMVVAICDMAHIATTHYLHQGDLANARTSADIGILAAPYEETMRLDVVAVTEAEGDRAHAAVLLNTSILNRSDDDQGPRDLSERTRSVIKNRRWSAAG